MKRLIAGMACVVSLTLGAAAASAGQRAMQLTSICGNLGAVKLYFGVGVAHAFRSVKLTSAVKTTFNAGYISAPAHLRPFAASSFSAAMVDNANQVAAVAQNGTASHGEATAAKGFGVVYSGVIPDEWRVNQVDVAATREIMQWAFFDVAQLVLPDDRAWVAADDREATSSTVTELDHGVWGVRLNAGIGYDIFDTLAVYCMLTYKFEFNHADSGNMKTVSFATSGKVDTFTSADGDQNLSANLVLASFRYNDNNIFSDVKVKAKVEETLGIMGGFDWKPAEYIGVFAHAGVKRYTVEVSYANGAVAYPGTNAVYTKDFLESNGKARWLVEQGDVVRKWSGTQWPFAFGGGVRFVFLDRHNFQVGVEYASFEAQLKIARDSQGVAENERKELSVTASDPYAGHTFARENFKDGTGVHQFAATDVKNTISVTKLVVSDFTLFGGYMLTL